MMESRQGAMVATLLSMLLVGGIMGARLTFAAEVVMQTSLGQIVIEIDEERAPITAAYFLGYIDRGQYDGATLYRSAALDGRNDPQLVQGGILASALNSASPVSPADHGAAYLESIETTERTGLRHERGTVSLARDLIDTGHVIPEIVFCLRDIPSMDAGGRDKPDSKGFPAFAKIISGMDVVEAVTRQALDGDTSIAFLQGQILTDPVTILHAYRRPQGDQISRQPKP